MKLKEIRAGLRTAAESLDLSKKRTYIFNRWVFRGVLFLIIVSALVIAKDELLRPTQKNIYVSCPAETIGGCFNPVFNNSLVCGKYVNATSEICLNEYLPPGYSYGVPPGWLFKNFAVVCFIFIVLGFIINHLFFNKDFDFRKAYKKLDRNINKANEEEGGD